MDTIIKNPKVTVLMPVYNGAAFLREAIESVLRQTYADMEILVIDDGSTDGSAAIISSYADPRIRFEQNDGNKGIIFTLNRGMRIARGAYVARMDADDICVSGRIERQVRFLDEHPDVAVVGGWIRVFGSTVPYTDRYPETHDAIRTELFFKNAFAHPTVMFRREVMLEHELFYEEAYKHVEDYALWVHASRLVRLANLQEVLLRYRVHGTSVSKVHSPMQIENTKRIRIEQVRSLGIEPSDSETQLHQTIYATDADVLPFLQAQERWLGRLLTKNNETHTYPQKFFAPWIGRRWLMVCFANGIFRPAIWRHFFSSPLHAQVSFLQDPFFVMKFLVKCVVRKRTVY